MSHICLLTLTHITLIFNNVGCVHKCRGKFEIYLHHENVKVFLHISVSVNV